MSTNIHFIATREVQVVKTGVITIQEIKFDEWQTPTSVTRQIMECAEVCAKQSFHYAEHNNPGSAASAADACRILIKQHFGVIDNLSKTRYNARITQHTGADNV
jgi:hypothetical protein